MTEQRPTGKGALSTPRLVNVIRENLVERYPDLELMCPDAFEIVAPALAALHAAVNGRAAELSGDRDPAYFRDQIRGRRAFGATDEARLSVQAPTLMVPYYRPALIALAKVAPLEMAEMLGEVIQVVDEQLSTTRERLFEVQERAKAWRKA